MLYDIDRIIEDADVFAVAKALGLETNENSKKYNPETGDGLQVLCPFHNDQHFGSAAFVVKRRSGKLYKGFRCWACNTKHDLPGMVGSLMGLSFPESLEFIAKTTVGDNVSCYTIDGGEADRVPGRPFCLSGSELRFIGLGGHGCEGIRGAVINAYSYKPEEPTVEHVVYNKERYDGTKEYQPFCVEHLVIKPVKQSIQFLYNEDYISYQTLVLQKIEEKEKELQLLLKHTKGFGKADAQNKFEAKNGLKQCEKLREKVLNTSEEFQQQAEQKFLDLEAQEEKRAQLYRKITLPAAIPTLA